MIGHSDPHAGDGPPDRYQRLRAILLGYASRITVDTVLANACAKAKVTPVALDRPALERLVHEVSPGVRMFCKPEEVPKLMLAIAEIFD